MDPISDNTGGPGGNPDCDDTMIGAAPEPTFPIPACAAPHPPFGIKFAGADVIGAPPLGTQFAGADPIAAPPFGAQLAGDIGVPPPGAQLAGVIGAPPG